MSLPNVIQNVLCFGSGKTKQQKPWSWPMITMSFKVLTLFKRDLKILFSFYLVIPKCITSLGSM
jgi:hypothetical protein